MGGKLGYITGPLQIAGGAASEYFAPGNPFGIPLITGGIGQTAGTLASRGRGSGGMMGELGGAALGGLGEGFLGMGPLGSTLGGTGFGQSLQGSSFGKMFMPPPTPPAGSLGSSVAAGVTPIPTGAPGAFPAPGATPVAIDPATQQMYESMQRAPTTPPEAAPAAPKSDTISSLVNSPVAGPVAGAIVHAETQGGQSPPPASTPSFKGPISQAPVAPKGQAPATSIQPAVTQVPRSQRRSSWYSTPGATFATPAAAPAPPSVPGVGPSLQEALTMQQYLQQLQAMGMPVGLPLTGA